LIAPLHAVSAVTKVIAAGALNRIASLLLRFQASCDKILPFPASNESVKNSAFWEGT
jgi:hypothetical protein